MAPYFVDDIGYAVRGGYMWRWYDKVFKYGGQWHFLIEFQTEDKPHSKADVRTMVNQFANEEYPPGHQYHPFFVERMEWFRNKEGDNMNACLVRMNRSTDVANLSYISRASEAKLNATMTQTHFKRAFAFPFVKHWMVMVKYCDSHELPEVQTWVKDSALTTLWRLHPDPSASRFHMPPFAMMSDFWAGAFDA